MLIGELAPPVVQVYTVPVYDMIEHLLLKKGIKLGFFGRFIYRTTYVGCERSRLTRTLCAPRSCLH